MSNFRNLSRKSRQGAARRDRTKEKSRDEGAFRWWDINLGEGDCGQFMPALDAEGQLVEEDRQGHRYDTDDYACTADHEDFHGHCIFCMAAAGQLDDFGDYVSSPTYKMMGVWDSNLWVPKVRDGRTLKSRKLYLPAPGEDTPSEALLGESRFFRMGSNRIYSFYEYAGKLEEVCTCVAKTEDPKISKCVVKEARCPRCGIVLVDNEQLAVYKTQEQVRTKVLEPLAKCKPVSEGGCWQPEDETAGFSNMFMLDPVFECQNNLRGGECEGADPCNPYMGPALITRVGKDVNTTYRWERDENLSWKDWMEYKMPAKGQKFFAEGMDFTKKVGRVLTLKEQADKLGLTTYPLDAKTKSYGPRRRPRR